MRKFSLNIAGYYLNIESCSGSPDLVPSRRFRKFIHEEPAGGINIRIYGKKEHDIEEKQLVFQAPYVEEEKGVQIKKSEHFWSVWKTTGRLMIKVSFPFDEETESVTVFIPEGSDIWEMWIDTNRKKIDPMSYPLDGLILYYLTVVYGDIMIHASGITDKGKGYIFSGVSGKGKSTMASIWKDAGAKVVNDDRLIIRKSDQGYVFYNTPIYDDEEPLSCGLDRIFLIDHGLRNEVSDLNGISSVTGVLANCIQHNWKADVVESTLESVSLLCDSVPVSSLVFIPDSGIVDYIRNNIDYKIDNDTSGKLMDLSIGLLSNGRSVHIYADGYSMYPTIKPGEKILIEPKEDFDIGHIVAIRHKKRIIVHRLVEIIGKDGKSLYITRGDSNRYKDEPLEKGKIIGVVEGYGNTGEISRGKYLVNRIRKAIIIYRDKILRRRVR